MILRILACIAMLIISLPVGYIFYGEIRRLRSWRRERRILGAVIRPKCHACGSLDQELDILQRLYNQKPLRHEVRWRNDIMRLQITCWRCGALFGADSLMKTEAGIDPATWSSREVITK